MILDLGQMTLPDTLLPKIQQVFGGTTPIETRDAVRSWAWTHLRNHFLTKRRQLKNSQLTAELEAALQTQDDADSGDFPLAVVT